MTSHHIFVLGVGRSGTTAIYSFLQQVLETQDPDNTDFVYEPFLFDRHIFNRLYLNLKYEFQAVSSISIDGIYHHKRIPLLLTDASAVSNESKSWLRSTLTPSTGKRHLLAKLIRANGRIALVRELFPNAKIIFVVRNPIDVMNSALQSFSFFGSEYYASDQDRFFENVRNIFGPELAESVDPDKYTQSQYLYWLCSNRLFLEYVRSHPENILTVAYESFEADKSRTCSRICGFLNLEFEEEYLEYADRIVGPMRQKASALSAQDFDFVRGRFDEYTQMLAGLDIRPRDDIGSLVKYGKSPDTILKVERPRIEPFNSAYASRRLKDALNEIQTVREEIQTEREAYKKLQDSKRLRFINRILAPVDHFRNRKKG